MMKLWKEDANIAVRTFRLQVLYSSKRSGHLLSHSLILGICVQVQYSQPVEHFNINSIKFLNTVWNVKLSMIIQVCFFPYLSFKLEACIHAYYAGFFKQIIKDMLSWRTN